MDGLAPVTGSVAHGVEILVPSTDQDHGTARPGGRIGGAASRRGPGDCVWNSGAPAPRTQHERLSG